MSDRSDWRPCLWATGCYPSGMSQPAAAPDDLPRRPRRAPSRRRTEATLEKIFAATEAIIARDGLLSLSTNRIAREAGISVGAIYQYFPNKEAVVVDLYRRALDGAWREIEQIDRELGENPTLDSFIERALPYFSVLDRDVFAPYIFSLGAGMLSGIAEADAEHSARVTQWLAHLLKRMGSAWPDERLRRYAIYLYAVFSAATWEALQQIGSIDSEVEQWRDETVTQMISRALAGG